MTTTSSTQEALINSPLSEGVQTWVWQVRRESTAYRRAGKRLLDIALGLPLLIVALPVILALAVAVLATTGWPAFYKGPRVGKDGRPFGMWKLRTMVSGADRQIEAWKSTNPELAACYLKDFKVQDDPRVTPI